MAEVSLFVSSRLDNRVALFGRGPSRHSWY